MPSDQIDPMWLEKSYYLEPDKAAAKPYALLREALKEADRVAVVTVSIRTRMTTAVLRVRDDVIVMQTMLWPDEVRKPDFGSLDATEHAAKPKELKMARLLVDTLAGDYDADDYEDDYQKAVQALVKAKLEGGEVQAARGAREVDRRGRRPARRAPALGRRGQDLARRGAGRDHRRRRGRRRGRPSGTKPAKKPATKKTASKKADEKPAKDTKKTAAKKTSAKKTAAKKTAARKAS